MPCRILFLPAPDDASGRMRPPNSDEPQPHPVSAPGPSCRLLRICPGAVFARKQCLTNLKSKDHPAPARRLSQDLLRFPKTFLLPVQTSPSPFAREGN